MRSLGTQILFGFSGVESGFSGVPRFLVSGAMTTRCLRVMFPLAILRGLKSFEVTLSGEWAVAPESPIFAAI